MKFAQAGALTCGTPDEPAHAPRTQVQGDADSDDGIQKYRIPPGRPGPGGSAASREHFLAWSPSCLPGSPQVERPRSPGVLDDESRPIYRPTVGGYIAVTTIKDFRQQLTSDIAKELTSYQQASSRRDRSSRLIQGANWPSGHNQRKDNTERGPKDRRQGRHS
jgi:hypothetical protein